MLLCYCKTAENSCQLYLKLLLSRLIISDIIKTGFYQLSDNWNDIFGIAMFLYVIIILIDLEISSPDIFGPISEKGYQSFLEKRF